MFGLPQRDARVGRAFEGGAGTRSVSGDAAELPVVAIIESDRRLREDLTEVLHLAPYRIGAYPSVEDFLAASHLPHVSCLVADITLIGRGRLVEHLEERHLKPCIVAVTGSDGVSLVAQAMQVGVVDFLGKPVHRDTLLATVANALARRQANGDRDLERALVHNRIRSLTVRQRQTLTLVMRGWSNKMIAHALQISRRTVETHRALAMKRLGVKHLTDLVRLVGFSVEDFDSSSPPAYTPHDPSLSGQNKSAGQPNMR